MKVKHSFNYQQLLSVRKKYVKILCDSIKSTQPPLLDSQCLQEESTSTSSQLAELMMVARVNLAGELPCDLPQDTMLSRGTFLINLEGKHTDLSRMIQALLFLFG